MDFPATPNRDAQQQFQWAAFADLAVPTGPSMQLLDRPPQYSSYQRCSIDHAQLCGLGQGIAAFTNIHLPFQLRPKSRQELLFDCPHIPQRKTRFQQFRIGLGNELKSGKYLEIIRARKNRVSLREVSRNCNIYNILMHPTQALLFPTCAHSHPYAPSNVQ